MSFEANNTIVLVPQSHASGEGCFAQALCGLGGGQQVVASAEGRSLLIVTKSLKNVSRFKVEKVIISPSSCQEPSDELNEWKLGEPKESTELEPGENVNCILLGPSIINHSIYGGQLPPGTDFIERFGIIKPEQDPDDGQWCLNITMPSTPYRGIGCLTITQTL